MISQFVCKPNSVFLQIQKLPALTWTYAEYATFEVGPESDRYRLSVSNYAGTAENAFMFGFYPGWISNGHIFSTPDNDTTTYKCATSVGWWFNVCSCSALNGMSATSWSTGLTLNDVIGSRMMMRCD
jgi:Fibrinogen beta and gamma chains, C-terminal globular domain